VQVKVSAQEKADSAPILETDALKVVITNSDTAAIYVDKETFKVLWSYPDEETGKIELAGTETIVLTEKTNQQVELLTGESLELEISRDLWLLGGNKVTFLYSIGGRDEKQVAALSPKFFVSLNPQYAPISMIASGGNVTCSLMNTHENVDYSFEVQKVTIGYLGGDNTRHEFSQEDPLRDGDSRAYVGNLEGTEFDFVGVVPQTQVTEWYCTVSMRVRYGDVWIVTEFEDVTASSQPQ
jgi:hypothetical protein